MPESGSWANEFVFSIPLSSAGDTASPGYPGVIVFECTPLGDVTDDLEKWVCYFAFIRHFGLTDANFSGNTVFWTTVLDSGRS